MTVGASHHRLDGRDVVELIFEELDGEIDARSRQLLRAHLGDCDECRLLQGSYRRLQDRMAGPIHDRAEIARARTDSLRRISVEAHTARRSFVGWLAVPGAVLLVFAVAAAAMFVRTSVATPSYPDREVVLERSFSVTGGQATLVIEQGARYALPGEATGVVGRADVRFGGPQQAGLAEIRFLEPGESFGIIARAPDLRGVSRLAIEGRFPSVERGVTKTLHVWLYLEPGGIESDMVTIELTYAAGGGTRAVLR